MLRLNDITMKVKRQNGLTLIEVLIVIALLMLILLALFRSFGKDISRSRDAERKSDLAEIKLAFEDYYNDHQTYPPEEYLADCDGDSLQPYLRAVPCDPVTGEPYLYIPFPGNGDNSRGYRVLSILEDDSDPIIAKLGCQNGCGVPEDRPEFPNSSDYVYGIAEGVALSPGNSTNPTLPASVTFTPGVDPNVYCETHPCYCCASSSFSTDQDCNIWVQGNNCDMGPYTTLSQCYRETPCQGQ